MNFPIRRRSPLHRRAGGVDPTDMTSMPPGAARAAMRSETVAGSAEWLTLASPGPSGGLSLPAPGAPRDPGVDELAANLHRVFALAPPCAATGSRFTGRHRRGLLVIAAVLAIAAVCFRYL